MPCRAKALSMLEEHAKQTLDKTVQSSRHDHMRQVCVEMNVLIAGTCKAVQVEQKF